MCDLLTEGIRTRFSNIFAANDDNNRRGHIVELLNNSVLKNSISRLKTTDDPDKVKEELILLCELLCECEFSTSPIATKSTSFSLSTYYLSTQLQLLRNVFWNAKNNMYNALVDCLLNHVIIEWGICWTENEREHFFDPLFLCVPPLPAFLALTHFLTPSFSSDVTSTSSSSTSAFCSTLPDTTTSLSLEDLTLNEVLRLLIAFVTQQRFVPLFLDYLSRRLNTTLSASLPSEATLITLVTSLPARVANRTKGKVPKSLHATVYVESVTAQILTIILNDSRHDNMCSVASHAPLPSSSLSFLTQFLAKFVLLGPADVVAKCLIPHLLANVVEERGIQESPSGTTNTIRQLFASFPTNSYEALFEALLTQLLHHPQAANVLSIAIGPLLNHPQCHFLWTHKFLLVRVYSKRAMVLVVDFLAKSLPKCDFLNVLIRVADVWGSTSFILNASHNQHLYVTQQLVYGLRYVQKDDIERSGLLVKFIRGVQHHLQSPLLTVRTWGMILGEAFSKIVDPNNPLHFEYEKTAESDFMFDERSSGSLFPEDERTNSTTASASSSTFRAATPAPITHPPNNTNIPATAHSHTSVTHTPQTAPKESRKKTRKKRTKAKKSTDDSSEEGEGLNPDQPFLADAVSPSSPKKERNANDKDYDSHSSSSTDSLVPYDLDDDLSDVKAMQMPRYLRECIVALNSDEPDILEAALRTLPNLIRQHPDELDEVSVTLASVLLHLRDEYSLADFHSLRLSALTALVVHSTPTVVSFLTTEFYKSNYGLNQRLDILDVLTTAARELSQLPLPPTPSSHCSHDIIVSAASTQSNDNGKEISRQRVEKNTRLITKRARLAFEQNMPIPTTVGSVHSAPNRFAPHAGLFFFPLLRFYDNEANTFNLLGEDSVLLGKLVYSLGVFVECVGGSQSADFLIRLCRALIEFLWCIRYHPSAYVRRALLYALTAPLSVMPSHILLDAQLFDDLYELQLWVQDIFQNDTDDDCKNLAMVVLYKWQHLMENSARSDMV